MFLPSGLRYLDSVLDGGWWRGRHHLIAKHPNIEKSIPLYNFVLAAGEAGTRIVTFTLDADGGEVTEHLIAIKMGIPFERLKHADLTAAEYTRFMDAAEEISTYDLYIEYTYTLDLSRVRRSVSQLKEEIGLDLVFVDHVDGLSDDFSRTSGELAQIARDFNVAVVSSVNTRLTNPQTELKTLKRLEQNTDIMLFVYRDNKVLHRVDMLVAKNNFTGLTGTIHTHLDPVSQLITDTGYTSPTG